MLFVLMPLCILVDRSRTECDRTSLCVTTQSVLSYFLPHQDAPLDGQARHLDSAFLPLHAVGSLKGRERENHIPYLTLWSTHLLFPPILNYCHGSKIMPASRCECCWGLGLNVSAVTLMIDCLDWFCVCRCVPASRRRCCLCKEKYEAKKMVLTKE